MFAEQQKSFKESYRKLKTNRYKAKIVDTEVFIANLNVLIAKYHPLTLPRKEEENEEEKYRIMPEKILLSKAEELVKVHGLKFESVTFK